MHHEILLATAVSLLLAGTANAALLTHEGFDYQPASQLNEQGGGTGWDGVSWGQFLGGTGDHTIAAGSLSDPTNTLQTSGHRTTTGGAFAGRYPRLPDYGATSSSFYYSLLVRPDSEPDTDDYYGLQLFSNNGGSDLFIGKGGSAMTYRLEGNSTSSDSTISATLGQTVLLVVRVDFNPSGNTADPETFRLYVNPVPGATEPATADATLSFNLGNQNGLALNSGNGSSVSFDEIRIGTDYASVVPAAIPEPASLPVLALATALLARRRQS